MMALASTSRRCASAAAIPRQCSAAEHSSSAPENAGSSNCGQMVKSSHSGMLIGMLACPVVIAA